MSNVILGQMDIFSFLSSQDMFEPPILLSQGQKVYKVIQGDVEESIVTGEYWICGENNVGYRLKVISGRWDVVWNNSIGVNVFTDPETAYKKAEQYRMENDCILAENIKAKEVFAYKYIYQNREIIKFYAVLDNDSIYFDYGSMYEHIGSKKELADFQKKQNENKNYPGYEEIMDYHPVFKNMYKCDDAKWKYAEARYGYING